MEKNIKRKKDRKNVLKRKKNNEKSAKKIIKGKKLGNGCIKEETQDVLIKDGPRPEWMVFMVKVTMTLTCFHPTLYAHHASCYFHILCLYYCIFENKIVHY